MSMIRVGHKPDDWRDEGPSTGYHTRHGIRGGGPPVLGGSLVTAPPRSGAQSQAEYKARQRAKAHQ